MRKLVLMAVVVALACGVAGAADKASNLKFVVLKDANGKPVRNASVILHAVNKKGKQEKGGLQLKTSGEGKTEIAGIPYGKLRIQVIAPGLQTYGQDYDINQPETEISIRMKPPAEQVTIYGDKKPDDKPK
jgi:hypothetical protein